ncbi:hypothetical protein ccbrp13_71310 [Ktedonobacteria bacterium brp13]|nr:hypothetical protein ccbrp13_71310 [Ktedonobacteria bacterium brp13]
MSNLLVFCICLFLLVVVTAVLAVTTQRKNVVLTPDRMPVEDQEQEEQKEDQEAAAYAAARLRYEALVASCYKEDVRDLWKKARRLHYDIWGIRPQDDVREQNFLQRNGDLALCQIPMSTSA